MGKMIERSYFDWSFSDLSLFKRTLTGDVKFKRTADTAYNDYEYGGGQSFTKANVCDAGYPSDSGKKSALYIIEPQLSSFLLRVGVMPKYAGYRFVRECIMFNLSCGSLQHVTTRVYPHTAAKFSTNKSNVERDIRHALNVAFLSGKLSLLNQLLGEGTVGDKQPLTNNEFIALVTEYFSWQMKSVDNCV